MYTDIDSLSSVSDFQISAEKRYALENGVKYFVNVDGTEDWEWLVNVKVNYFKLSYCWNDFERHLMAARLFEILEEYKSRIPDNLFLHVFQLFTFLVTKGLNYHNALVPNMYLQYLADKQLVFFHNATPSKMIAREMLNQINTVWLEEMTSETDSSFKIISNTFLENSSTLTAISASPDNKLLAILSNNQVKVYELPSLKSIFKLDLNELSDEFWQCIVFSPDSSYFLLNSIQTCISIKNQSIVPFIPHGPAKILCSSFSSCGTRLVSAEKHSIKVWDVTKKELLTESWRGFDLVNPITCFSCCMSYIFLFDCDDNQFYVFDSTALNILEATETDTCSTKLDAVIQLISPRSSTSFVTDDSLNIQCWQLTTGENILFTSKHCSMPFVWKGSKCVMTSSATLALVVYDYVNQQVIDTFQISSLQGYESINYIANLGENNFLICFEKKCVFFLSLESSSEFSAFSFINDFTYPIFYSLSPDNLYVACSSGSPILKIMSVDNGKTLQTVAPKKKPIACWWSDLYLWVVCKGVEVIKYPNTSTDRNVVGNNAEECCIYCGDDVLEFKAGVLVCCAYSKISISKICGKNLSRQQILDSKLDSFCEVAISSDGCAVLLYQTYSSYLYELWEMGSDHESKWELHSTGELNPLTVCGCLAGKQNSRRLLWLLNPDNGLHETSPPSSIDFTNSTPEFVVYQFPIVFFVPDVIYVDSKLVICVDIHGIHFIHVPDGGVITSLYVGDVKESFFVPSKRLLFLFFGNGIIKHFKVHNIDEYLPLR